jgi:hypothetical protein
MEINGLVVLAVLWALLNLLGKLKKEPEEPRRIPRLPDTPDSDATQREGSRLETMLRQFERALEQAEPITRPTTMSLPGQEEIEDRESLERDPEVVSLETEVERPERRVFDHDADAEHLVARRISAAAARDSATSRADHAAFDVRIRQEPADKTATSGYTAQQLRDAVVWREILGPPVSLREDVRSES